MRGILPRRILAAAEQRSRAIGMGADRVLICADAITEDAYLQALAASLGTSYDRLDTLRRADVPLSDSDLIRAATAGLMPIREAGRIVWMIAPSCWAARRLADPHRPVQRWINSFRLTSSDRLQRFIAPTRGGRTRSACRLSSAPHAAGVFHCSTAAHRQERRRSDDSDIGSHDARILSRRHHRHLFGITLRDFSGSSRPALVERAVQAAGAGTSDSAAATVSYRSTRSSARSIVKRKSSTNLVAAIRALDYPIEKLDVKFVLEADDGATRRALTGSTSDRLSRSLLRRR